MNAQTQSLMIWKVGSPHRGNMPSNTMPIDLLERATAEGLSCTVQSFPASDFHLAFSIALNRGEPDILVIDNYGILTGITTPLGIFTGIYTVISQQDMVPVYSVFDSLLGETGGWVFLLKRSQGHHLAVSLAFIKPPVPPSWGTPMIPSSASSILRTAQTAAEAFVNKKTDVLWSMLDPEHMMVCNRNCESFDETLDLEVSRIWGNNHFAFCGVSFRLPMNSHAIGGGHLVVALRRLENGIWKVLFVSGDPISLEQLNVAIPKLTSELVDHHLSPVLPVSITSPENGHAPEKQPDDTFGPDEDDRFGFFKWRRDPRYVPLAELTEFASCDSEISEARIIIHQDGLQTPFGQCSFGWLWSTGNRWQWRVWSIGAGGQLAFSSWREFYN